MYLRPPPMFYGAIIIRERVCSDWNFQPAFRPIFGLQVGYTSRTGRKKKKFRVTICLFLLVSKLFPTKFQTLKRFVRDVRVRVRRKPADVVCSSDCISTLSMKSPVRQYRFSEFETNKSTCSELITRTRGRQWKNWFWNNWTTHDPFHVFKCMTYVS